MLSAHFTTLEMGARALTLLGPTSVMYLTPKNALIAELSRRNRGRHTVRRSPATGCATCCRA